MSYSDLDPFYVTGCLRGNQAIVAACPILDELLEVGTDFNHSTTLVSEAPVIERSEVASRSSASSVTNTPSSTIAHARYAAS